MTDSRPVVYHGTAIADGTSDRLVLGMDVIVEHDVVVAIEPTSDDFRPEGPHGERIVDARGATLVPGLVDCHSHVTMPGGADWVRRATDPDHVQLAAAEHNAMLLRQTGVRWARDTGAQRSSDPALGPPRALSLHLRERWRGNRDYPYLRASGTWLSHVSNAGLREISVSVDGADLFAAAQQQLDEGADFLKLYLDGPDPDTSPFSTDEVRAVVEHAHGRGAKVTAHSTSLAGARAGVGGGVDSLEHAWALDDDIVTAMLAAGTVVVSTLAVLRSMQTFAATTTMERFTDPQSRAGIAERYERGVASIQLAHRRGVPIAVGSDFGGGSLRANQLSWEIETLAEIGLPLPDVLAGATWRAGDLLGEPEAGRLRVGGPADFFLVHGDPLTDPRALSRVWLVH